MTSVLEGKGELRLILNKIYCKLKMFSNKAMPLFWNFFSLDGGLVVLGGGGDGGLSVR